MPADVNHSPPSETRPRTATDPFAIFVGVLVVSALAGQVAFVVWVVNA